MAHAFALKINASTLILLSSTWEHDTFGKLERSKSDQMQAYLTGRYTNNVWCETLARTACIEELNIEW